MATMSGWGCVHGLMAAACCASTFAAGLKVQLIEPVGGHDTSQVRWINKRGEVSFSSYTSTANSSTGSIWREGQVFNVPFAGNVSTGIINDSGVVSGVGFTQNTSRGFRWSVGGAFELLEALPGAHGADVPSSSGGAISNSGIAGGTSRDFNQNRQHAVIYNVGSGSPIDLFPGSSTHSFVRGINSAGDILVSFNNTDYGVYNGGIAFTTFLPSGLGYSMNSLSESRSVAGWCLIQDFFLGFPVSTATRWNLVGNSMQPTVLPRLPGWTSHFGNAINKQNAVAGKAFNSAQGFDPVAVVWVDGSPINLNDVIDPIPGVFLKEAVCINDNMDVGGIAERNGLDIGFVLHLGDADGDGLLDIWEAEGGGIDSDGDGIVDLDLHALGARPDHKDLFVEVDSGPSVRMPAGSIRRVVDAFARAPLDNPDGTTGIRLHVMSDESNLPIPTFAFLSGGWPSDFDTLKQSHFGTPTERTGPAVIAAKKKAFRYCIVYNQNGAAHGIGEQPGNDFAIFLGNDIFRDGSRDLDDCASVFMHELGHNLGLGHGGADLTVGKTNYPSIMNYALTHLMPYNAGFWKLDYCRRALATLDENNLDESAGIGAGAAAGPSPYNNFFLPYGTGPASARVFRLARLNGSPVDWNGNGFAGDSGVVQDLNFYGPGPGGFSVPRTDTPSPGQVLDGHDDWAAIEMKVGEFGNFADSAVARTPIPEEPTPEAVGGLAASVPPAPIPWFFQRSDFNDDGMVDDADFSIFVVSYNDLLVPPAEDRCDINGDDLVDDADFSAFIVAYDMLVPG